jgi:hypothetical protein
VTTQHYKEHDVGEVTEGCFPNVVYFHRKLLRRAFDRRELDANGTHELVSETNTPLFVPDERLFQIGKRVAP